MMLDSTRQVWHQHQHLILTINKDNERDNENKQDGRRYMVAQTVYSGSVDDVRKLEQEIGRKIQGFFQQNLQNLHCSSNGLQVLTQPATPPLQKVSH